MKGARGSTKVNKDKRTITDSDSSESDEDYEIMASRKHGDEVDVAVRAKKSSINYKKPHNTLTKKTRKRLAKTSGKSIKNKDKNAYNYAELLRASTIKNKGKKRLKNSQKLIKKKKSKYLVQAPTAHKTRGAAKRAKNVVLNLTTKTKDRKRKRKKVTILPSKAPSQKRKHSATVHHPSYKHTSNSNSNSNVGGGGSDVSVEFDDSGDSGIDVIGGINSNGCKPPRDAFGSADSDDEDSRDGVLVHGDPVYDTPVDSDGVALGGPKARKQKTKKVRKKKRKHKLKRKRKRKKIKHRIRDEKNDALAREYAADQRKPKNQRKHKSRTIVCTCCFLSCVALGLCGPLFATIFAASRVCLSFVLCDLPDASGVGSYAPSPPCCSPLDAPCGVGWVCSDHVFVALCY